MVCDLCLAYIHDSLFTQCPTTHPAHGLCDEPTMKNHQLVVATLLGKILEKGPTKYTDYLETVERSLCKKMPIHNLMTFDQRRTLPIFYEFIVSQLKKTHRPAHEYCSILVELCQETRIFRQPITKSPPPQSTIACWIGWKLDKLLQEIPTIHMDHMDPVKTCFRETAIFRKPTKSNILPKKIPKPSWPKPTPLFHVCEYCIELSEGSECLYV